jgi:hypothetical protein
MNLETVRKSIAMAASQLQEFNYFRKFYADTVVELIKTEGGRSLFKRSFPLML